MLYNGIFISMKNEEFISMNITLQIEKAKPNTLVKQEAFLGKNQLKFLKIITKITTKHWGGKKKTLLSSKK